jgi:hypothetical protein
MPARNVAGQVSDRHGIPLLHALRLDVTALDSVTPTTSDSVLAVVDGELVLATISDLPLGSGVTIHDILSANAILTVSQPDVSAADVTLTVDQTQIDHNSLTNYVADEHVAHSGVTLSAGVGLSGGGTIAASRTFDIDWTELTEDTNPDESADFVATYDTSAATHKKVKLSNIQLLSSLDITALTEDTNPDEANDFLVSYDASAGSNKKVKYANVDHDNLTNGAGNKHIDHTAVTLTAGVGLSGGGDISASRTFDIDITELTEDTNPDEAADFLITYDTSAGSHKKVKPDNLVLTLSNLTGTLGISHGGTGQTTQTAAMDALSPTSAKGDLLIDNGTNVVAQTVGANGTFLQADSTQSAGVVWSSIPGVSDTIVTLGTDRQTTSTALADITGLSFAMAASTMYYFKAFLFITANAVGEGNLISVNATNAPTFVNAIYLRYVNTPTTPSCTPITARDGGAVSSGVVGTTFNFAILEGVYSNAGSTDTLQLRFRTETGGANSTTVEAGSFLTYRVIT